MNNTIQAMPSARAHRVCAQRETDGLALLLFAACVLVEADPVVGLAMRAGLYLWRRHGL